MALTPDGRYFAIGGEALPPPVETKTNYVAFRTADEEECERESQRVMRCPGCDRVASVAPWCARPICVHDWESFVPEIWDGNNVDGNGRKIEDSPCESFRAPGPTTWAEMLAYEPLAP